MTDPSPTPAGRRSHLFPVLATFVGTLGAVALGVVAFVIIAADAGWRPGSTTPATHEYQRLECPALRFEASAAESRRAVECEAAAQAQRLLVGAGARGASVSVRHVESSSLTGPPSHLAVVVQVFPDDARLGQRPADLARTIAAAVGTMEQHVIIVDDRLRTIYDGGNAQRTSPRPGAPAPATASPP